MLCKVAKQYGPYARLHAQCHPIVSYDDCSHFSAHVLGVCGPSPVSPGWLVPSVPFIAAKKQVLPLASIFARCVCIESCLARLACSERRDMVA